MTVAQQTRTRRKSRPLRPARRAGYVVTVIVNLALLFIVNNLLEWGWFPFLTESFEEVLPILSFSLVLSAALNVVFIAYDALPFKTLGEIVLSIVSLMVIVRTYQVFPFEFTGGPWTGLTRVILILGAVGVTIGIFVESVQLVTGRRRH